MDSDSEYHENSDSTFVWDDKSQLYFHASSGFYHDPNAGWYYSSRDGAYYKFEDGNYVLLGPNEDDNTETNLSKETTTENSQQIYDGNKNDDYPSFLGSEFETNQQTGTLADEAAANATNSTSSPTCENPPPPPSEWLEDTLIDLYLSGYKNIAVSEADEVTVPLETDNTYNSLTANAYSKTYGVEDGWIPDPVDVNGLADNRSTEDDDLVYSNTYELEEGEWIPNMEDENGIPDGRTIDEGILLEEEKWRAQYGQVTESGKDLVSDVPIVDLWDWEMVTGSKRDGKYKVARLVGRLVKPSAKQHPSIPSGCGKFRSAPICEAHLNLVRVKTGQVYRLRNPSAKYVASLSTYDSSNPTEDWDFPQLSHNAKVTHLSQSSDCSASASDELPKEKDLSALSSQLSGTKQMKYQYRDRAAERRTLHGGFGMGPGQKNVSDIYNTPSSPDAGCLQEAPSEALDMSFGEGSYARKLLKNMGWKEGEGLGSSMKGMVEPIKPVGNVGTAGLGWSR